MGLIRSARLDDAAAITSLTNQLGYSIDETRTRDLLGYLLNATERDVLVFDDRGVVAWLGLSVAHGLTADPHAEVMGLIVDQNHRSRGLGSMLMTAGEDWARAKGCSRLRLRTNLIRAGAHRFYERLGYSTVKEQRVYEKEL